MPSSSAGSGERFVYKTVFSEGKNGWERSEFEDVDVGDVVVVCEKNGRYVADSNGDYAQIVTVKPHKDEKGWRMGVVSCAKYAAWKPPEGTTDANE